MRVVVNRVIPAPHPHPSVFDSRDAVLVESDSATREIPLAKESFVIEREAGEGSDGDKKGPGRERVRSQHQPEHQEKHCGYDQTENGNVPRPLVKPVHVGAPQRDT